VAPLAAGLSRSISDDAAAGVVVTLMLLDSEHPDGLGSETD